MVKLLDKRIALALIFIVGMLSISAVNAVEDSGNSDIVDDGPIIVESTQNVTVSDLNLNDSAQTVLAKNTSTGPKSVTLSPSKLSTTYRSGKYFKVKVIDSKTKKPVAKVKLIFKVYTGKKHKTKYVTTNANGIATYKASTLSKGTHKIVISAVNAKANSKNSKVVIKPRSITIKAKSFKVHTADFAGGGIDIQVKDKSSKKGLNGVSLTLKIKNGKKYKTVKLVTGYDSDDKKNGIAGIITNQYLVGTHKVTIKPTSKNYKGSATAKIVITKSAKKNYYNFHIYFTKGKIVSKVYR